MSAAQHTPGPTLRDAVTAALRDGFYISGNGVGFWWNHVDSPPGGMGSERMWPDPVHAQLAMVRAHKLAIRAAIAKATGSASQ